MARKLLIMEEQRNMYKENTDWLDLPVQTSKNESVKRRSTVHIN